MVTSKIRPKYKSINNRTDVFKHTLKQGSPTFMNPRATSRVMSRTRAYLTQSPVTARWAVSLEAIVTGNEMSRHSHPANKTYTHNNHECVIKIIIIIIQIKYVIW